MLERISKINEFLPKNLELSCSRSQLTSGQHADQGDQAESWHRVAASPVFFDQIKDVVWWLPLVFMCFQRHTSVVLGNQP